MPKPARRMMGAGLAAACMMFAAGTSQAQAAGQSANEKLAWDYYKPGNTFEQRMAFIATDFVNHSQEIARFMALNPQVKTSKEAFRLIVETRGKLAGDPDIGTNQASSLPWKVLASGDLVTVIHLRKLPDPTRAGQTYDSYQFDLFRVQGGKFVEHWDGNPLAQPLPPVLQKPVSEMTFPAR